MPPLLRGALVEYKSKFLGPVPNVVIFQFNPEQLRRQIQLPSRTTGSKSRESRQSGEIPNEKIDLTAHFSAADQLNNGNPVSLSHGIAPQLAALELMACPKTKDCSSKIPKPDAIGKEIAKKTIKKAATTPIPREIYPNILFIWGATRVLPVVIDSLSIEEQQFDSRLIPIQAEVSLGLTVIIKNIYLEDPIAIGAAEYSAIIKKTQAAINLVVAAKEIEDIIPF